MWKVNQNWKFPQNPPLPFKKVFFINNLLDLDIDSYLEHIDEQIITAIRNIVGPISQLEKLLGIDDCQTCLKPWYCLHCSSLRYFNPSP